MLKAEHITVRYGEHTVVDDLSFSLQEGQWLMLVGPNGAGKSTLIEAIAQGVPYTGSMALCDRDIRRIRPAQLAQQLGVLSQRNTVGYAYTVEEVVSLGRYAYTSGIFSRQDKDGQAQVEQALALTGLTELRHASVLTLSGGEL
ncbi:MAG: ABC transporter ATP-binding protein [Clostridia bacterium]|nr:ABC transporter ATP-binding protein [Clostridia bacterium]